MCDNNEQRRPRSLADIVREKTNDGDTIVQFYLDVANGKLDDEGFEACHRRDAAKEIQAIAPEIVAEAIARLAGIQCHPERRTKRPTTVVPAEASRRSRAVGNPSPDASRASAARRHESLEYLASALAAPSLAVDPRVTGIVRESTDQGKTVVSFLLHVMHGVVRGFRPNNRMQAAMELIGHIARDELRRSGSLPVEPALSAVEGSFPPDGSSFPRRREPIPGTAEADLTVTPAFQGGGDEGGLPPSAGPFHFLEQVLDFMPERVRGDDHGVNRSIGYGA